MSRVLHTISDGFLCSAAPSTVVTPIVNIFQPVKTTLQMPTCIFLLVTLSFVVFMLFWLSRTYSLSEHLFQSLVWNPIHVTGSCWTRNFLSRTQPVLTAMSHGCQVVELTIEQSIDAESVIRAAVDAGKVILDIYNKGEQNWEVEVKSDDSPLTRADR